GRSEVARRLVSRRACTLPSRWSRRGLLGFVIALQLPYSITFFAVVNRLFGENRRRAVRERIPGSRAGSAPRPRSRCFLCCLTWRDTSWNKHHSRGGTQPGPRSCPARCRRPG